MLTWCFPPRWFAGLPQPWAQARDSRGTSEVVVDGWQEKLKHSDLLHVSKTIFPQLYAATHARYWSSMQEAAGSREGATVLVATDPMYVLLLLALLWTTWEGGKRRQVAGWPAVPSYQTLLDRGGEWGVKGWWRDYSCRAHPHLTGGLHYSTL